MSGMRAIAFKVRFAGLYEWGGGWISGSKAEAWNSWFENLDSAVKPSHWGYCRRDSGVVSQHLVCASGSVYLHPLEMSCVMQNSVISRKYVNGEWVEIYPEVEELKEILTGAANACGGIVEFSDITFGELPTPKFSGKE